MLKEKHLPIFGVGPIYVISIIVVTVLSIYLSLIKVIPTFKINELRFIFSFLGLVFIVIGLFMWINAAIISKLDSNIKNNQLIKSGVYAYVRNPIYSAFMSICTGAILFHLNIILFFLPIFYWLFMTILMKCTEEKWLHDLYGYEYDSYCKKVNRCLPWFKK